MFGDLMQFCFFRLNENLNICSIIENHLKPGPWNHQLRQFCEEQLDCLKFFIRKYPKVSFLSFTGGIAPIEKAEILLYTAVL
jgi:hypothetical protein